MTETSPVSAQTTTDDPLVKRLDSVGRLLPHVEAKVVCPTNHTNVLPRNQKGELAVAGYLVQKGYWNDPVRTAEVMVQDEEGKVWMHVSTRGPPNQWHVENILRLLIRADGRRGRDGQRRIH